VPLRDPSKLQIQMVAAPANSISSIQVSDPAAFPVAGSSRIAFARNHLYWICLPVRSSSNENSRQRRRPIAAMGAIGQF